MVIQALQNGGCVSIENGIHQSASLLRANQDGRKCLPISSYPCKNDRSTTKYQGVRKMSVRLQSRNQENSGINTLSNCTNGLASAGKTESSSPTPTSEKLDEWMKESVIEIVRHIQEAPFLHYVFDRNSSSVRLKRQRVSEDMFQRADSWRMIRNCLRDISPDGVIFVQRLNQDSLCRYCAVQSPESGEPLSCNGKERQGLDEQGCTDTWGLIIQGRSIGVSACYLLKTTQIVSGNGFCTQFCLTRAKCFDF
eukprot:Gb_18341 [translate_table: standard]